MKYITNPSITRLARKAGVKSLSEDSYDEIIKTIDSSIENIIKIALVVNNNKPTKTLMIGDIYDAMSLDNNNVAYSTELGQSTCR
tara:strand:+ start:77 stop:331 length:255 start_codon:yes stop_codon:yes gene_type:complete